MAGKHRKSARRRSAAARRGGTGLAAAAVGATSLSTAFVTGTTPAVVQAVELMAVITPANSTSQFFAGTTYYGTDYGNGDYGEVTVVPFLAGPEGIADAIRDASENLGEDEPLIVLASGWGAGQTGTALGMLSTAEREDIDLVILDNNTNRAGGGFWTTYGLFAPLLLTEADPTPINLPGVVILDVGYQYNINSNAPTDPLNPFSLGNSLAAYVFGYGAESTALTIEPDDQGDLRLPDENGNPVVLVPGRHYVVENGRVVDDLSAPGPAGDPNTSTIYVTVVSEDLPLTRPLRLIPGGDILADALDPTLRELVDAGYEGGQPIPTNPTVPRPMRPGSSFENLDGLPGTLQTGLREGGETLEDDISNPTSFVTKPINEIGKLPVLSSLVNLPTTSSSTTGSSTTRLTSGNPNKFLPGLNSGGGGSSASSTAGNARPGQRFADRLSDAVDRVTGGLRGDNTDNDDDSGDGDD
jgi:PE-PPE domain